MACSSATPTILISANLAWNLVNFRAGLIRFLIDRGFHVVGVAPADPLAEAQLRALGCGFEPVKMDAKGLSPVADIQCLLEYCKLMKKYRPAAYLGYTVKPNVYGGLAARLCGIPHIANISGLGTAFIRQNIITSIVSGLYRIGLARTSTIFFQNISDRDLFLEKGLIDPAKVYLVPGSGIDTDHFYAAAPPTTAAKNFLMVGRLLRDKGVLEYVEAARIIRAERPDVTFKLMGFLDVQNRTAISRSQVDAWVASGVIEYLPPTDDVRPFVEASDCVVLPSYREGTSRVLLEAAAMARTIVATDVPGCREVVIHGKSGLLCKPRDPASLAAAIKHVIGLSSAELAAMGRAGRTHVARHFTQDIVNRCYWDALQRARVTGKVS